MKMLILGASYGSLLSTKLLMTGHDVTLICRSASAVLINSEGTEVRIKLRDEDAHRAIRSADLPGSLNAVTPEQARPEDYDMIALAMQEPQYSAPSVRGLMARIAASGKPCLSIMNMPPLPFLRRIESLENMALDSAYDDASVWQGFEPGLMSLCSPDPQAFRPPEEGTNILHVGLPTNFKAAVFADPAHTALLKNLPNFDKLSYYQPRLVSKIFTTNGNFLEDYSNENRIFINYNQIPRELINCFLVSEDINFYNHFGVDFKGIARAFFKNMSNIF